MSQQSGDSYQLSVPRGAVRSALTLLGAAVVVAATVVITLVVSRGGSSDALSSQVIASDYQAVFLTSNEIYFGKLSVPDGGFAYLTHAYRLLQTATGNKTKPLRRTLVPVIRDVHAPLDEMIIDKTQILYVENLNPAGAGAKLLQRSGP
jgi:hypothetical protein